MTPHPLCRQLKRTELAGGERDDDARHRGSACERAYDAGLALTSALTSTMTQDPRHAQAR